MEGQTFTVKIITCQRCYQHNNIDPHNEMQYFQIYEEIKTQLSKINIRCIKNQPFKYLVKMPDTKHSSKRYLNHCTSKIIQFPQRGSFQVYFMNIVVYSKLEIGVFPDINTLIQVIKKIRDIYCQQPLLKEFQNFKNIQMQWNTHHSSFKPSIIGALNLYLPAQKDHQNQYSNQTLQKAISFMSSTSRINFKEKILPYSFYGVRQRHCRIQNIYCPKSMQKCSNKNGKSLLNSNVNQQNLNDSRDTKTMRIKQKKCFQAQQYYPSKKLKTDSIFNMVRIGTAKTSNGDTKDIKCNLLTQRLDNELNFSEHNKLYFSNPNANKNGSKKSIKITSKPVIKRIGFPLERSSSNNIRVSKSVVNNHLNENQHSNIKINILHNASNSLKKKSMICPVSHMESLNLQNKKYNRNLSALNLTYENSLVDLQKKSMNRLSQVSKPGDCSKCQRHSQHKDPKRDDLFKSSRSQRDELQLLPERNSYSSECQLTCKESIMPKSADRNKSPLKNNQRISQLSKSSYQKNILSIDRSSNIAQKINNEIDQSCNIGKQQQQENSNTNQDFCLQMMSNENNLNQKDQKNLNQSIKDNQNLNINQRLSIQKTQSQIVRCSSKIENKISLIQPKNQNIEQNLNQNVQIQRALILQKFSQLSNFDIQTPQIVYNMKGSNQSFFNIEPSELIQQDQYMIKLLSQVYQQKQLKLFPHLFKPLRFKEKQKSTELLVEVVNLIIKNNPQIITRIFQNKRHVNHKGVYCVWLENKDHLLSPIVVDDHFAFYKNRNNQKQLKPIYGQKDHQGAIWFMILQKAVAKVLGGYNKISESNLSQLFRTLLGCPTIEMKSFNPLNINKILSQKLFFNKKAYIYTLNKRQPQQQQDFQYQNGKMFSIERIIGFQYNKTSPLLSNIHFQTMTSKISYLSLQDFLVQYTSISLVFFNWNYCFNQKLLPKVLNQNSYLLTIQLESLNNHSTVFISLGNFKTNLRSKITIYKQLSQEQMKQKLFYNKNHLDQELNRFQYTGQITKKGNFFFQTIFDKGKYLCLLQSNHSQHNNNIFKIYSDGKVNIGEIKQHENIDKSKILQIQQKLETLNSFIKSRIKDKTSHQSQSLQNKENQNNHQTYLTSQAQQSKFLSSNIKVLSQVGTNIQSLLVMSKKGNTADYAHPKFQNNLKRQNEPKFVIKKKFKQDYQRTDNSSDEHENTHKNTKKNWKKQKSNKKKKNQQKNFLQRLIFHD